MTREFTQAEVDRHNALTKKGWALTEGQLLLHGQGRSSRPGWFARRRLGRAIRCFEEALSINPEGWPSMWALGKIYQRIGAQATALGWFARAHTINPSQPDVAREAGIAALEIGHVEGALGFCRAAVTSKPEDAGLICNLALAHCLAGDDAEAERYAAAAAVLDPSDGISANVLAFVRAVASGSRQRPKCLGKAFP